MKLTKNLLIITKLLLVFVVLVKSKPNWTYEVISIDVENAKPDVVVLELHKKRISRGVYAISGIADIKQDLTDDFLVSGESLFSPTGSSNYAKSAFQVAETTLSKAVNTIYKDMLMESVLACSDYMPNVETTFVAPLTKRLITMTNCQVATDKLPSVINYGYHKIIIKFSKQANITVIIVVKIEPA